VTNTKVIETATKRVPFYELAVIADGGTVKTFSRKIYRIKGLIARNVETNEVRKVSSIYYEIRTVQDRNKKVIAKRRNPKDELKRV
jgi:hypothetical protein